MNLCGVLGAINGGLSVAIGAFSAHKLKGVLDPAMYKNFETGAEYQFYHALALLALAAFQNEQDQLKKVAWLFQFGILIFSGGLYILSITGYRKLGAITPIGGVSFLIAWCLLIHFFMKRRNNQVHSQRSI